MLLLPPQSLRYVGANHWFLLLLLALSLLGVTFFWARRSWRLRRTRNPPGGQAGEEERQHPLQQQRRPNRPRPPVWDLRCWASGEAPEDGIEMGDVGRRREEDAAGRGDRLAGAFDRINKERQQQRPQPNRQQHFQGPDGNAGNPFAGEVNDGTLGARRKRGQPMIPLQPMSQQQQQQRQERQRQRALGAAAVWEAETEEEFQEEEANESFLPPPPAHGDV